MVSLSSNKPLVETYTITPVSCRIRQWFCALSVTIWHLAGFAARDFHNTAKKTLKLAIIKPTNDLILTPNSMLDSNKLTFECKFILKTKLTKVERNIAVGRDFRVFACEIKIILIVSTLYPDSPKVLNNTRPYLIDNSIDSNVLNRTILMGSATNSFMPCPGVLVC